MNLELTVEERELLEQPFPPPFCGEGEGPPHGQDSHGNPLWRNPKAERRLALEDKINAANALTEQQLPGVSAEARNVFKKMSHGMRLVVPIGDKDIKLVADPRFRRVHQDQPVTFEVARELIYKGYISELTQSGKDNKIGWMEMGLAKIGFSGAKIFACTQ